MKYERLCWNKVFALTLTLSPRRGDACANPLPFDAETIYSLSLEGEGWGEGVSRQNRVGC